MTHLLGKYVNGQKIPQIWKEAWITSIHKPGSRQRTIWTILCYLWTKVCHRDLYGIWQNPRKYCYGWTTTNKRSCSELVGPDREVYLGTACRFDESVWFGSNKNTMVSIIYSNQRHSNCRHKTSLQFSRDQGSQTGLVFIPRAVQNIFK